MSAKELYIHIGTGKTGTTSIQQYIESNESVLRDSYDLNYLKTGRIRAKHSMLDFNSRRQLDNHRHIVLQELNNAKKEILESKCRRQLISNEAFPGLSIDEIDDIKNTFSPEITVKVIVYLRRQDEYLESWFNQTVKTGSYSANINRLFERLNSEGLLNYPAMLDPWESVLGTENIIVRVYEKQQFVMNNLHADFLNIFGIDHSDINPMEGFSNASLNRDQIILLRKLAKNGMRHLINKEFIDKIKMIEIENNSKYVLSKEKRHNIALQFCDLNKEIAEKYFNRGDLFIDPLPLDDENDWVPRSEVPDKLFLGAIRYLTENSHNDKYPYAA